MAPAMPGRQDRRDQRIPGATQQLEKLRPHTFRLGSPDPRERYETLASLTELVLAGVAEADDDESARQVEQLRSVKAWLESRPAKEATDA